MSNNIERKLAAIMFTDIAGYTALSSKDENKALQLLNEQKQILPPLFEKFKGTLHKEIGDGLLITFTTVTSAINCAIEIQQSVKNIEGLDLRIGIHEGEINLLGDDALGDDVNIASRIVPFSPIGGIAISDKVKQDIASLPEYKFKLIIKTKLKGVPQKISIYCINAFNLSISPTSKSVFTIPYLILLILILGLPLGIKFYLDSHDDPQSNLIISTEDPSITVLLPEFLSKFNNENIPRTIAEDLIINISRYSGGKIILPSIKEILEFKGGNPRKYSEKLNTNFVFESSLIIENDKFELRCRLLHSATGKSYYSKKWVEKQADLPIVLEVIAIRIIQILELDIVSYPQETIPTNISMIY
jgi:TolB-like protein